MENTWEETRNKYKMAAVHFADRYGETVSDHIIDVMISVMMTKDNVLQGGSFVQAVVGNNLKETISRADTDCSKNIRIITICSQHCYVETEGIHV